MAKKKKDKTKDPHGAVTADPQGAGQPHGPGTASRKKRKDNEREMRHQHGELVAIQEWVKATGAKICIFFEGRDTAGKGGRSSASPSE